MIKPKLSPKILTPDVKELIVCSVNGNRHPFSGLLLDHIFQVIFMETGFWEIHDRQMGYIL